MMAKEQSKNIRITATKYAAQAVLVLSVKYLPVTKYGCPLRTL